MFVNFTNHPSAAWSDNQTDACKKYGTIEDIAFPNVPSEGSEEDIDTLADGYVGLIMSKKPDAVLCQGEMTLCFAVTMRLMEKGVKVLCACSERRTHEQIAADGTTVKTSVFEFVRFREYTR